MSINELDYKVLIILLCLDKLQYIDFISIKWLIAFGVAYDFIKTDKWFLKIIYNSIFIQCALKLE